MFATARRPWLPLRARGGRRKHKSAGFQGRDIIQRQITLVHDRAIVTMADQRKSYMFYRTAPLMTLNDPKPRFKGHAIL